MKNNARNSNIELLRIIAMGMIVMGHFIGQSGYAVQPMSHVDRFLVLLLSRASRIGVNVFLIVGAWYLVDMRFKAVRVFKLYGTMLFYSSVFTLVALAIGSSASLKDIGRGFLPFFGRALWFVSAYITLLVATPFLNDFFRLGERKQKGFLILGFILICGVSTLPEVQEGYLVDSLWFWFVYLAVGFCKKKVLSGQTKMFEQSKCWAVIGILVYVALVLTVYAEVCCPGNRIVSLAAKLSGQYLSDIKTLPNFFIAFLVTQYFFNLKPRTHAIVNRAASYTLSVYCFHQVPALIPVVWNYFSCKNFDFLHFKWLIPVAIYAAIFFVVILIEEVVRKPIGKWMLSLQLVQRLIERLDQLMSFPPA